MDLFEHKSIPFWNNHDNKYVIVFFIVYYASGVLLAFSIFPWYLCTKISMLIFFNFFINAFVANVLAKELTASYFREEKENRMSMLHDLLLRV